LAALKLYVSLDGFAAHSHGKFRGAPDSFALTKDTIRAIGERGLLKGHPPARGLLVTIDGPNAAGKTSLAGAVADRLEAAGDRVHRTCQPSPTRLGDTVRAAEPVVNGRAFACLVARDRHHQSEIEIIPQLRAGATVLCDRYIESSLVLQRFDGVELDYILAINRGIPRPGVRIQLLAAPEVLSERLAQRTPGRERRFESEIGPARELQLYADADRLLTQREQLPASVFDTTATDADRLGAVVAALILTRR
jgi:dTMP kinase